METSCEGGLSDVAARESAGSPPAAPFERIAVGGYNHAPISVVYSGCGDTPRPGIDTSSHSSKVIVHIHGYDK